MRILAARGAVVQNRLDLIPKLVENLADRDEAVRMFTSIGLRKLTGKDFGYNPSSAPEERLASIKRWEEWVGSSGCQKHMEPNTPQSPGEGSLPPPGTALKGGSAQEPLPGARDG